MRKRVLQFYALWSALGLAAAVIAHVALYFKDLSGSANAFDVLYRVGMITFGAILLAAFLASHGEQKLAITAPHRHLPWPQIAIRATPFVYVMVLGIAYLFSNFSSWLPLTINVGTGWNSGAFVTTWAAAFFYSCALVVVRRLLSRSEDSGKRQSA